MSRRDPPGDEPGKPGSGSGPTETDTASPDLVNAFQRTVDEGTVRLRRTWRALLGNMVGGLSLVQVGGKVMAEERDRRPLEPRPEPAEGTR